MSTRTIRGVTIEFMRGNIADRSDMEAIVNAVNAELRIGGGVAGAIHRAAGPGLAEECLPLDTLCPGQAVITSAHRLPNRFVIHCLGPIYGVNEPAADLLASCYHHARCLKWAYDQSPFPPFQPAHSAIPWKRRLASLWRPSERRCLISGR